MTFSIAARSSDGTEWGVAVASKFLAVGAFVPAARAGIGAVATQAHVNTTYKQRGLHLLRARHNAQQSIESLLAADADRDQRQVGIVDALGGAATFTGSDCYDWAGGMAEDGVAIQGNVLVGPQVVSAMSAAWHESASDAPLTERLLAVLTAGDDAGGDKRGRQSAALLVVKEGGGYAGLDDVLVDLRVDDHPRPCVELARLLELHALYFGQPAEEDKLPLDDDLRRETHELAQRLGHADLDEWVGTENFENRVWPDAIDRAVLDILRAQAAGH